MLLTVDEAARLLRTTRRDLRDDRTSSGARGDPHSSARAVPCGRPATLAGPEARAIAGGVDGDERHTTTIPGRRLGSGHHHPAAERIHISESGNVRPAPRNRRRTDGQRIASDTCCSTVRRRRRRRCLPSKHSRQDSWTATRGRTVTSRAASTRSNPSSDGISFRHSARSVSARSRTNSCSG
jgi:hypothetical protein